MIINWSVKFLPHKRGKNQDSCTIRMRVTLRGKTPLDFPLGVSLPLDEWDAAEQRAKSSFQDATIINRKIDEWRGAINEVMARYELLEKRIPDPGEIKELFNDMVGRHTKIEEVIQDPVSLSFFQVYDRFTQTMGAQNQWTDATFQKFKAMKSRLNEFDPLISFHTLSDAKMQEFVAFLMKKGLKNTTIAKNLAFVRWFLRWADAHGYYSGKVHETFRPKLKGTDGNAKEIIYLTQDEVKRIADMTFKESDKHLEQTRDVFLFCCYTGLRFSDVAKLKRCDVKENHIDVVTQKTVDGLKIELNKHSRAILDKYKECKFKNDLALPVPCNVRMNLYLKDIAKAAGIDTPTRIVYFNGNQRHEEVLPKWALITTHVARRTFVVTALQLGIAAEVIMRWTGHSKFEAMKPYIAIVDELKKQSMTKFDKI
ncbi:MAG: phage integrase SAM-like domain-containing protein [Ruminococcus sp.]|nr:phage integrase SAM-like domain-containing protein [Ruminococcus sp.]